MANCETQNPGISIFKARFEELINDSCHGDKKSSGGILSDRDNSSKSVRSSDDAKHVPIQDSNDAKHVSTHDSDEAKHESAQDLNGGSSRVDSNIVVDGSDCDENVPSARAASCESNSPDKNDILREDNFSAIAENKSVEAVKPRFEESTSVFMIGDVVKARLGFMMFEGVVVGIGDESTLDIDFGDEVESVPREDCSLVISGLEFEVGDLVSACPIGGFLYFNGVIVNINMSGTFDVQFDGDDDEDIERNIRPENIRKLRTGRQLVMSRWQKAKNLISATRAFAVAST